MTLDLLLESVRRPYNLVLMGEVAHELASALGKLYMRTSLVGTSSFE